MLDNQQRREKRAEKRAQLDRQRDELYITSKELSESGFTRYQIKKLGQPELVKRVGWADRYYWLRKRVNALRPSSPRKSKPATQVDALVAIFAVNRAAKRYRDAAQICYQSRAHNFATAAKEKKEALYRLKEKGIACAFHDGRLVYCGRHGALAIYRGEGYCFHSTLEPMNVTPVIAGETIFVEAKPRGAKEARLTDAKFTLQQLDYLEEDFRRLDAPRIDRPKRPSAHQSGEDQEDYNGEDQEDYNGEDQEDYEV